MAGVNFSYDFFNCNLVSAWVFVAAFSGNGTPWSPKTANIILSRWLGKKYWVARNNGLAEWLECSQISTVVFNSFSICATVAWTLIVLLRIISMATTLYFFSHKSTFWSVSGSGSVSASISFDVKKLPYFLCVGVETSKAIASNLFWFVSFNDKVNWINSVDVGYWLFLFTCQPRGGVDGGRNVFAETKVSVNDSRA